MNEKNKIKRNDYNYIKGLMGRRNVSHDEAREIHRIYATYCDSVRARVLDPTCSSCLPEMWSSVISYIENENLIIVEDEK